MHTRVDVFVYAVCVRACVYVCVAYTYDSGMARVKLMEWVVLKVITLNAEKY